MFYQNVSTTRKPPFESITACIKLSIESVTSPQHATIALSEVAMGSPVPGNWISVMISIIGPGKMDKFIYDNQVVGAQESLKNRLVGTFISNADDLKYEVRILAGLFSSLPIRSGCSSPCQKTKRLYKLSFIISNTAFFWSIRHPNNKPMNDHYDY
jgi:enoyl-CoA hydratase/carnithine racemase